jgi:hypothetical protein
MGADAGLHIYRTEADFMAAHPSLTALGLALQDLSNIDTFRRRPHLAWGYYGSRMKLYREVGQVPTCKV